MGFSLRAGRFLTGADSRRGARVCVLDEDFARYYWPHTSALGHRLFQGSERGPDADAFTVVGVVGSIKQAGLTDDAAQARSTIRTFIARTATSLWPYGAAFGRIPWGWLSRERPGKSILNWRLMISSRWTAELTRAWWRVAHPHCWAAFFSDGSAHRHVRGVELRRGPAPP